MRKLSLLVLIAAVSGCGDAPPPPEHPAQETVAAAPQAPHIVLTPVLEDGQMVYQSVCWTCHGTAGRGDGPATAAGTVDPPPSFHTQDFATATGEDLQRRFRVGMDDADQTHPHMQYVASFLKPESFQSALTYIPALVYPPELPGSALAGQEIYGFRCAACHGEDGRGQGPAAAALTVAKPADFTRDTLLAARDWDGAFGRIREGGQMVHGSSMPPWGIVLKDAEMWDLVAYLATFQDSLLSTPPWKR